MARMGAFFPNIVFCRKHHFNEREYFCKREKSNSQKQNAIFQQQKAIESSGITRFQRYKRGSMYKISRVKK
jgi:hypothetical protein